ncbi:fructosamine-3-kinase [Aliiruegeria haliotis]|uniref:Fructosamine-3-kinase n=1 Tax=Aliiruegeria haliotis TaxID=1280846 RepID=A0A2T0RWM5_9RHOB|nr:fructosamine kinase family protein [Aliiruegeria haliotis]PRY25547.1 fructosamine-3-kinase [Aliiruegeria haliotis]
MPLKHATRLIFGHPAATIRPLHGGDLSTVSLLTLPSGRKIVAKQGPQVAREARMLSAMARAGAPVPEVLGLSGTVLFLEFLREITPDADGWSTLGHALRRLHGNLSPTFGWNEDYAFGAVAIPNTPRENWPDFWAEQRLFAAPEALPTEISRRLDQVCKHLDTLLPARPPAALLHGDLWSGNLLFGPNCRAAFIDPACYYGDAEVDLAMLHLFGAPPGEFLRAYGPLAPGWDVRRNIYQLWPALVHLRLFGNGYLPMIYSRLSALGF